MCERSWLRLPSEPWVYDDAEAEEKALPLSSSSCKSSSCMFYFRVELTRGCEAGTAMSKVDHKKRE